MEHSDKLDKIGPALLTVQGAVSGVEKNSKNPAFKSRYADLAATNEATREHLTAAGVVCTQWPGAFSAEARTMDMTTMLLHAESGQWIKGTISIPLSKVDAQGYGSCCTYARRYALQAALGLSPEDDDGNEAVKPNSAPQAGDPRPAPKAKAREVDAEMRTEIDACDSVEQLQMLWNSKPFQAEYNRHPKDWQDALVEHFNERIADIRKSTKPVGMIDPRDQFNRIEREGAH